MEFGFTRIALATPTLRVGATSFNALEIIKTIKTAAKDGVEVIAFPKNCLTGNALGSMKSYSTLLDGGLLALSSVASETALLNIVALVSLPLLINGKVESACVALFRGVPISVFFEKSNKENLPAVNCDFSEKTSARSFGLGKDELNICILNHNTPVNKIVFVPSVGAFIAVSLNNDLENVSPISQRQVLLGANIVFNLAENPSVVGGFNNNINNAVAYSKRLNTVFCLVSPSCCESVSSFVSSGEKIIAENGVLLNSSELDEKELIIADVDVDAIKNARLFASQDYFSYFSIANLTPNKTSLAFRKVNPLPFVPSQTEFARIWNILSCGVYRRMQEVNTTKVILGLSGGLDSTMVLILAVKLFKKYNLDVKNIIAVTMKGFGSSGRTQSNANKLIQRLKVTSVNIPIDTAVALHLKDIAHEEKDTTYENAQARERAQVLLDLANKYGALLLGTSDLSEIALGWSTFGGDQVAHYNPNRSVPKTLIRALLGELALSLDDRETANIIDDILKTPISPELLPNQETETTLGAYELHDFILFNLIGCGFSPKKTFFLLKIAYKNVDKKELLRCLELFIKRFFSNQFKRSASCDGIQLFEFDLTNKIIHSDFSGELWLNELKEIVI